MQGARESRLDAQQKKKVRDEILSEMEKVYQRMQSDKEEMRKRMQADKDEIRKRLGDVEDTQEAAEKAMEWTNERILHLEENLEKLEKTTAAAMKRAEEKTDKTLKGVEERLESSSKHMQNITHAVLGGFGMLTLAVLILFITLLVKI